MKKSFLPGELQHSSDLQYGNGTVAELVICLVINIKDGTNSTSKTRFKAETRERRKTSENVRSEGETSPVFGKALGHVNQESQTHHEDSDLPRHLPVPTSLSI